MAVDRTTVTCRECGAVLERLDVVRCPQCGSIKRHVHVKVSDAILIESGPIRVKGKDARLTGKRKVVQETFIGRDLEKTTGKRHDKYRLIDRRADRYRELVVDHDTGEQIHVCDEPLSEHRGHGSAKPNSGRKSG